MYLLKLNKTVRLPALPLLLNYGDDDDDDDQPNQSTLYDVQVRANHDVPPMMGHGADLGQKRFGTERYTETEKALARKHICNERPPLSRSDNTHEHYGKTI